MAARAVEQPDLVGQILGHFRILERVGAGGMGVVYRAHDQHLECDVAVKVLPAGALNDEDARKRFRREALALSKLHHPNIEIAHDFDTQEGVDFLVTEFISGRTLEMVLASWLPEKEILNLGAQLAEGLAAAHEQGIVHRDLKPSNLLVTTDGRLKILDFGLAKMAKKPSPTAMTESLSGSEDAVGTPPYMAPEQLLSEKVDARTDIWAAGAVLYEMATRQRPFLGSGPRLVDGILHEPPTPPSGVRRKVSPGLEAIILKCLEKDPANRYQSAREITVDLRRLATAPATAVVGARRRRRRWRVPVVAAAAAVLLAGLLLAVNPGGLRERLFGHGPAVSERDFILVTSFQNRTGDAVFDIMLRKAVALDLDQSPYLNVVSDRKVAQALRLMGRDPEERLTPELGAELCQRNGIRAVLAGSLDRIGNNYLLSMQVTDAASGDVLAEDHQQAGRKEEVLGMVDKAAARLREQLGESLASIHKFEKPLPEATTSSLDALRALALGDAKHFSAYEVEAIGFYKRALELDPNFALAWARLASVYGNLGDKADAEDAARHAYALKDRVSERERLYILAANSEPAERRTVLELYRSTYPRDFSPWVNLSELDSNQQAEQDLLQALRLDPGVAVAYGDLAEVYGERGNMAKAMATCREGLRQVSGSPELAAQCYEIALAAHDPAGLQEIVVTLQASAEGRGLLAELERDRAFAQGQVQQSREQNQRMLEALRDYHLSSLVLAKLLPYTRLQLAAGYKVAVAEQLQTYPGLAAQSLPALYALAEAGETQAAAKLAPEVVQESHNPARRYVEALLAYRRGQVAQALALFQESGDLDDPFVFWYRGSVALRNRRQAQATADFNKLLEETKPSAPLYPWAAFAHIGLARCAAQAGNKKTARAEYERAFEQWKDADADMPLLRQAKAEYTKVQQEPGRAVPQQQ